MAIFGKDKPVPAANRITKVIGAIGVSSGTVDQDVEVAEAGVKAYENAA